MSEPSKTSARCECGALELAITGEPVVQLVCHCSDCRAFSGTPYVEAAFFVADGCLVQGKVDSTTIKGGTGFEKTHHMCASCETPLYVTVGALNGAFAIIAGRLSRFDFKPAAHIWTAEKVDSITIPAGIAQSAGAPPKELADAMVSSFWRKVEQT